MSDDSVIRDILQEGGSVITPQIQTPIPFSILMDESDGYGNAQAGKLFTNWNVQLARDTGSTEFYDTTNVIASGTDPKQSVIVRLAGTGTALAQLDLGSTKDISNCLINCRFYIPPEYVDQIKNLKIKMFDSTNAKWQLTFLWSNGRDRWSGWHEITFDPYMASKIAGGFNSAEADVALMMADFSRFDITLEPLSATSTMEVVIDQITAIPKSTATSIYCLTVDDGATDDKALADYLTTKGMRGTFYVIPSLIDTAGYLTLAELQAMQADGHLIANHSWSHIINDAPADYSTAVLRSEIDKAADWLTTNGFCDGARIWSTPGGNGRHLTNYLQGIKADVDQVRCTRLSDGAIKGLYDPSYIDAYEMDDIDIANSHLILAATNAGSHQITGWHSYAEGVDWSLADWKLHIDNVKAAIDATVAGTLKILTVTTTEAPVTGDTLTQAVSGATMTVITSTLTDVMGIDLETGVWDATNNVTSDDAGAATLTPSPVIPSAVTVGAIINLNVDELLAGSSVTKEGGAGGKGRYNGGGRYS